MLERGLVKPKIEYILKQGHHEARKDRFNNEHSSWDYAIKGKTVDGKILRVVVALIEPNVDRTKRICDNSN